MLVLSHYCLSTYEVQEDVEHIGIRMKRTLATHKYCYVCYEKQDLTVVRKRVRVQFYVDKKIYIPKGNRCCQANLM